MADTFVSARDWILFGSMDGTTYFPLACLTSNEFTSSNSPIDVSSKCGDKMLPGVKFEQSASVEGFTIYDDGSPVKWSTSKLYDLHVDRTEFFFRISKATPVVGQSKYEGKCVVSEWTETAPDTEAVTFSATLTVTNPPAVQTTNA